MNRHDLDNREKMIMEIEPLQRHILIEVEGTYPDEYVTVAYDVDGAGEFNLYLGKCDHKGNPLDGTVDTEIWPSRKELTAIRDAITEVLNAVPDA